MVSPGLSLILRCKNAAGDLPDLLDSILKQGIDHLQVVAIDNGSTDGTVSVLESYAGRLDLALSRHPQATLGELLSLGVRQARHETVFIVDSDHVCEDGLLEEIQTRVAVSPCLHVPENCYHVGWLAPIYDQEFDLYREPGCGYPRVFPRSLYLEKHSLEIDRAGLGEDHIISQRLLDEGHRLPSISRRLRHKNIMSLRQLFRKHIGYGRTLPSLPDEKRFVGEKARYFAAAFFRNLPKKPLLTLGVLGIKLVKLAGVLTGRLRFGFQAPASDAKSPRQ
jgi:glycosyltransferase involved in cell wall biosynthesis